MTGVVVLVKLTLTYYYILFYGRLHYNFVSKQTWIEMNSRIGNWKGMRNLELLLMLLLVHDGTCTTVDLGNFFREHTPNDLLTAALLVFLICLFCTQWMASIYFFIGYALEPIPKGCTRKLNMLKNQLITCDEPKCKTCRHRRTVRGTEPTEAATIYLCGLCKELAAICILGNCHHSLCTNCLHKGKECPFCHQAISSIQHLRVVKGPVTPFP